MAQSDQLPIPNAAKRDPESFELLRVWIAENNQHLSLRTAVWGDPAAWGLMLADLARHIADSYASGADVNRGDIIQRIKAAFVTELEYPTDLAAVA